jgi:hypothetical protein
MGKFKKIFRRLADPRADNARHELLEVLFIALAAVLCGAESALAGEGWGGGCRRRRRLRLYFTSSNSTSNISVAFGGMTPPAPRAP